MAQIKTGGRQKGAENIVTRDYRAKINKLLEELDKTIVSDFKELSPENRVATYVKLMQFVCPKPQEKTNDEDVMSKRASINLVIEQAGVMVKPKKK